MNANDLPSIFRVIFDGPYKSGRFVEVEDKNGRSIRHGKWTELPNGLWELRFDYSILQAERDTLKAEVVRLRVYHEDDEPSWRHRAEALEGQLARYKAALAEDQADYLANFLSDPDDIYTSNEEMASAILADRRRCAENEL